MFDKRSQRVMKWVSGAIALAVALSMLLSYFALLF